MSEVQLFRGLQEWGGTKLAGDVPYRGLREAGYTVDRDGYQTVRLFVGASCTACENCKLFRHKLIKHVVITRFS